MITSFYVLFKVVFAIIHFVILVFKINGQKVQFSSSCITSIPEKKIWSFWGQFSPGKKIGGVADASLVSTKSFPISSKSNDFGNLWVPRSTFKVDFLNVQAKFQKHFGQFPGESC